MRQAEERGRAAGLGLLSLLAARRGGTPFPPTEPANGWMDVRVAERRKEEKRNEQDNR